jgi:mannose PTS system EIIA component
MKKKFLIASHGKLAAGLQSSLEILANKGKDVEIINAYLTEEDYTPKITAFTTSVQADEQGVIFTDLFGGSVNQKVVNQVLAAEKKNIFVISNTNLAIVLSLLLSPEDTFTIESISAAIRDGQVTLVSLALPTDKVDEDLNEFF